MNKYQRTLVYITIFSTVFFIGISVQSALAATEFESGTPTGSITLQQTGTCCSGPDNYRQYVHYYYPADGFTFDRLRFFANEAGAIPVAVYVMNDNGSTSISAQPIGNTANLIGVENDTIADDFNTTAYSQGDYYEATFSPVSINSGQYLQVIFNGASYAATSFETSPEYWSYKTNEGGTPSLFTTFRQTISIQLCTTTCNPFGSFNGQSNSNIFTIINAPLPYGTTTASTTVNLSASFQVQAGFDYLVLPANRLGIEIYDAVTNELQWEYHLDNEENTALTFTYSSTTILTTGSKIMKSYVRDLNGNDLAIEKETFFNVLTNTYLEATGINNPRDNGGDLSQIDCDTFDIGCQFQKAITFLFVPSSTILDRYSNLWRQLRTKRPFGYVTAVTDQLNGLDDNATAAFELPVIPFLDEIFTPLRTAISLLMWGIFAVFFYQRRLTKLEI